MRLTHPSEQKDVRLPMASTPAQPMYRLGATPGFVEYLKALWARREFAIAIPTAELQAQHRNTVLGGLWHLLNPIMQVGVYYLIFGVLLNVNRGVDNLLGFLTIGVFTFHFTSKSLNAGAKAITSNEGLIRSIMFPRAILPVAVVLTEFATFLYGFGTMIVVVIVTGEPFAWAWLLVVPAVALQLLFNLGVALFVARLSANIRDVQQVLPFMIRIWFYLSAIIWPTQRFVERFPDQVWLLQLNPAYVYVHLMRSFLLDASPGAVTLWVSASTWAVVSALAGLLFFKAHENEYGRA